MDPRHRKQLTDDVVSRIIALWGGQTAQSQLIGETVNIVYEVPTERGPVVLRILHERRRSLAQVKAELKWIEHLASHGLNVCRPVASLSGRLIETIPAASGNFLVCAFERAPGVAPTRADLDRAHMRDLGRMIALMHILSLNWPADHRPNWDEKRSWLTGVLLEHDPPAGAAALEVLTALDTLPRDRESFGLVHNDVHVGNYHLHESGIWLFDFDNAAAHWRVSDLGTLWYFSLARTAGSDLDIWQQVRRPMLNAILAGYMQERPLSAFWIEQIPLFRRYRALMAYAYKLASPTRQAAPRQREHLAVLRAFAMDDSTELIDDLA